MQVQTGTNDRREILSGLVVVGVELHFAVLGCNWTKTGPGNGAGMFLTQVDGPI
jgi:hypothetical protein